MTGATATDPAFERLLSYIEDSLNFQTSSYNDAYLDRRISARMRRSESDGYEDYQRLLTDDEEERTALLNALSVNVTGFFRNPDVWEALRDVLATLTASGETRVWSAACSDGREAYSLAMLARDDPRVDADALDILATDIKPAILRAARRGEYRGTETNDLEEELEPIGDYGRYVEREGDRFRVREEIRDAVSFRRHDLIREEPPRTFDLVLCRNLFIYIDSTAKEAVFETIRSSLAPGGYLTIGMTETIPFASRDQFTPIEKRLRIYRHDPE
jgi:chemotaxis protein methyltransferase CheR